MARKKGLLVEYKSKGYLDKIVGNRPHQVRNQLISFLKNSVKEYSAS